MLVIKADSGSVTIYDEEREIVRYSRSCRRGETFGAERFEKELLEQRPGAEQTRGQQRLIAFVGPIAESYLKRLEDTDCSMTHQIRPLLALVREYNPNAVCSALTKAQAAGAFGADYRPPYSGIRNLESGI